jgi:hypothetical protein
MKSASQKVTKKAKEYYDIFLANRPTSDSLDIKDLLYSGAIGILKSYNEATELVLYLLGWNKGLKHLGMLISTTSLRTLF